MIGTTLELIRQRLNQDLGLGPVGDVVLSDLTNHGGLPFSTTANKIVMMVTNIQSERFAVRSPRPKLNSAGGATIPLLLDLSLLFLANFHEDLYRDGLDAIARVFTYFHRNPFFTHSNLPGLDPSIEKLSFEQVNLDITELSALMEMIGGKYVPAALYKVRAFPLGGSA